MPRLTLQEKRLETLKRQLSGRMVETKVYSRPNEPNHVQHAATTTFSHQAVEDTSYLQRDLLKIAALTTGALVIQFLLFFASRNHLLNLHF